MSEKIILFDLDGTLANIDVRRKLAAKPNGKLDWDIFFDPSNIKLDVPNEPVVKIEKDGKEMTLLGDGELDEDFDSKAQQRYLYAVNPAAAEKLDSKI